MSTTPATKAPETYEERVSKMTRKQFIGECRRSKSAFGTVAMVMLKESTYKNDPYLARKHGPGVGFIMGMGKAK